MGLGSIPRGQLDDLKRAIFCRILRHFSHSVLLDVSAHFAALDGEEFFVVEGSGWRGRRELDSQVFCHPNSMHALASMDKHDCHTSRLDHHHHHHNNNHHRQAFPPKRSSFVPFCVKPQG